MENIDLKDGCVKINRYYMRFSFCNKSRKRIRELLDQFARLQMENDKLTEQLDSLQMENGNLYSQNNELRIQMKNIELIDTTRKMSRKRETLSPLSRSRSRLLSRSRSRSRSTDSNFAYECGILAKENNNFKSKYKELYDEYQKYKLDCEDSKSKLRTTFISAYKQ